MKKVIMMICMMLLVGCTLGVTNTHEKEADKNTEKMTEVEDELIKFPIDENEEDYQEVDENTEKTTEEDEGNNQLIEAVVYYGGSNGDGKLSVNGYKPTIGMDRVPDVVLPEGMDFPYQKGDVLKIVYQEKQEPTADENKFARYGELVEVEAYDGMFQIKHSIAELIPFDVVKVEYKQWYQEDAEAIVIDDSQRVNELMAELSSKIVYEDYFALLGAGGGSILRFTGQNAEVLEISSGSFGIEFTMNGQSKEYGYPFFTEDSPLYSIVEKYFE